MEDKNYWSIAFSEAWHRTIELVFDGVWKAMIAILIFVAVALVSHKARGAEASKEWMIDGIVAACGTLIVGGCVFLFYLFVMIPQEQHEELMKFKNAQAARGLDLAVTSFGVSQLINNSSLVQVIALVQNKGVPTTTHGWTLEILTSEGKLSGVQSFGREPMKGLPEGLKPLDEQLQNTINTGAEIPGFMSFVFVGCTQDKITDLIADSSTTIVLSVQDASDRLWQGKWSAKDHPTERPYKMPSK
jgi:hypothetical protein